MGWETIGSAVLLIGMLVFIFPRMRHAVKNAPKGSFDDWKGFLIPIVAIILFVMLLISMV